MKSKIDRRTLLKSGAALVATQAVPAWAQDKPTLRFAAVFSDKDIRADMMRMLAKDVEGDFKIEPFLGGTLFKQGTELVALQRDNLEMGNIAPQDISKQMPAWSVLTSAYTFRDANHVLAFFASDSRRADEEAGRGPAQDQDPRADVLRHAPGGPEGQEEDQHAGRPGGIKLRMPPGDAWQLLGRSIGANPTPMAYAETYTGLQTGAIDGQDNPLPNVQNMKFYEVMSQIVLTSHLVAFDVLSHEPQVLERDGPGQAEELPGRGRQGARLERAEHLKREAELADGFKKQGLEVYTPDIAAFRANAQKVYLASDEAKSWAPGILDKILAVK